MPLNERFIIVHTGQRLSFKNKQLPLLTLMNEKDFFFACIFYPYANR